ncbi:MAG: transposase [candidate division Zixibacteria bacterium]|nr:transposase [candidate division Zixibacteria bacterium]
MPKLRHYDNLGTARFLTFSSYRRENYLLRPGIPELIISHLKQARVKYVIQYLGYVIMSEHVHLVLMPPDGLKLGLVIREIKSRMAKEYFSIHPDGIEGRRIFWQKRCYDHNCRSTETIIEKINYCHQNPVRRGLVSDPGMYKWSSYNWYQGKRDVPLTMNEYEL